MINRIAILKNKLSIRAYLEVDDGWKQIDWDLAQDALKTGAAVETPMIIKIPPKPKT